MHMADPTALRDLRRALAPRGAAVRGPWRGGHCRGAEPALPSSFRVGAAAQASIAAATAAAAAEVHRRAAARRRQARVDMRHAAAEFHSSATWRGRRRGGARWDDIAGTYRCGDGRWVRLHTNFPHHRAGMLRLLGCDGTREAVAAALPAGRPSPSSTPRPRPGFASPPCAASPNGMRIRRARRWRACRRCGSSGSATRRRRPLPPAGRPAAGRAPGAGSDAGHRRAGLRPDAGRAWRRCAAHQRRASALLRRTGRRYRPRQAQRHARPAEPGRARHAARGWRPGPMSSCRATGRGRSPATASRRPNWRRCALASSAPPSRPMARSGHGAAGAASIPWCRPRAASTMPRRWRPAPTPPIRTRRCCPARRWTMPPAICWPSAPWRRCCGGRRRADPGWCACPLAGTGRWLRGLGRLADGFDAPVPGMAEIGDLLEQTASGFGRLTALRHSGQLAETPPHWALPSVPLGTHARAGPADAARASVRADPGVAHQRRHRRPLAFQEIGEMRRVGAEADGAQRPQPLHHHRIGQRLMQAACTRSTPSGGSPAGP